jgi:hypothetical protein
MSERISTGEFENSVKAYQESLKAGRTFAGDLKLLANFIVDNFFESIMKDVIEKDMEEIKEELIYRCFECVDRYDSTKGKAFNYFTTIMLGHLKQVYRSSKKYNEVKKKYAKFMK